MMTDSSNHPRRPLTELEAFVGNILGREGSQSKYQHEESVKMRDRLDTDIGSIVDLILEDHVK